MSDEIRMTLLHHSTNDLIEELLMWRSLAAEHLDRIAELEANLRHNALWQASEDAEERAHLEKLVPDLKKRIAELEKDNDEFRQLIHDWIIILTPDDGYVPDSECVRQAMLVIDKEREE